MSDIATVQRLDFPAFAVTLDWLVQPNGELDDEYALATALMIAFGTDRLASVSDELPNPHSTDRRGWWGDMDAETIWGGWPIGSRFWLLSRSKITSTTVATVQGYIRECMQPFVDARIISTFSMLVERNAADRDRIDCQVICYRSGLSPVALRFQVLWSEMGLTLQSN